MKNVKCRTGLKHCKYSMFKQIELVKCGVTGYMNVYRDSLVRELKVGGINE